MFCVCFVNFVCFDSKLCQGWKCDLYQKMKLRYAIQHRDAADADGDGPAQPQQKFNM